MKKQTITILDHKTNKTRTIEVQGYALLGIKKRNEDGFESMIGLDTINAKEVAQMIAGLFSEKPEIKKAYLLEEIGGVVGGMLQNMMDDEEDDCDCENCVARRAAAAKEKENAN